MEYGMTSRFLLLQWIPLHEDRVYLRERGWIWRGRLIVSAVLCQRYDNWEGQRMTWGLINI